MRIRRFAFPAAGALLIVVLAGIPAHAAGHPPVVTTGAATGVTDTAATLNGTVNPRGRATTAWFDWGTTTAYGSATASQNAGSGNGAIPISAGLPGLAASTTYHFRVHATSTGGTALGADAMFTTAPAPPPPVPPVVTTGAATGVTDTAATLNGTVNPEGLATAYHFEYGPDTAYGTSVPVPDGSAGSGTSAVAESGPVTGLTASTTYHFRLDATNSAGTTLGADATFTTAASPPPSGVLTRSGATLMLGGQPYKTVGTNAYGLATCDGLTYSSADLDAFFSALRPESLTRFWVTRRASVAQVDLVVQRAAANNQMLIMSLIDGPNNCNATGDTVDANFLLQTGITWASYTGWIDTLVPRYVNSPAVGMWEIGNELDHYSVTPAQMAAFMQAVATRIKAGDPGHLVESGLAGNISACCNQTGTNVADSQNAPALDVLSIHEYQYDQTGNTGLHTSWSTYQAAATALGRPIIVGEVGALLNQPNNDLCRDPSHNIDWLLNQKFGAYLPAGASAVLGWNWMKAKPSWVGTTCSAGQHFYYGDANPVVTLIHDYVLP